MESLSAEYDRFERDRPLPAVIDYGIPVSAKEVYEYACWARHKGIFPKMSEPTEVKTLGDVMAVEFSRRFKHQIEFHIPYSQCGAILALWNNYSYPRKALNRDMKDILVRNIEETLGLGEDRKAVWMFRDEGVATAETVTRNKIAAFTL